MVRLNSQELELVLARNDVVSKYLGAMSLRSLLSSLRIPFEEAQISLEKYAVGSLFVTQDRITPSILEKIKKGIWDAETNDFFEKGEPVALATESIITSKNTDKRNYILVGHTRARFLYDQDPDFKVYALHIEHIKMREYIQTFPVLTRKKRIYEI